MRENRHMLCELSTQTPPHPPPHSPHLLLTPISLILHRSNVNILKEAEPHNPLKPLMNCFGGKGGEIVAPPGATAAAASSILNMPGFPGMGDFSFVNTGPSKKKSEAIGQC